MKRITIDKRSIRYILAVVICAVMVLAMISIVSGRPFRIEKLPDKGRNFGCGTCHVNPRGGGKRNPFGKDYENIGIKAKENYTAELGKLDSDGDGFTNDQEFAANTNPGDPESKPSAIAADPKTELAKAIDKGKTLFNDTKLGKTGASCNSCHPGGSSSGGTVMGMEIPSLKGAAASFPKYKKPAQSVITLSQMNNMCIKMIMEGEPLKLDSNEAIALAAYVTSLSNGVKINVGGE
jgi:cytochrome c peroxidase